jgi:hypothetical protein
MAVLKAFIDPELPSLAIDNTQLTAQRICGKLPLDRATA